MTFQITDLTGSHFDKTEHCLFELSAWFYFNDIDITLYKIERIA